MYCTQPAYIDVGMNILLFYSVNFNNQINSQIETAEAGSWSFIKVILRDLFSKLFVGIGVL